MRRMLGERNVRDGMMAEVAFVLGWKDIGGLTDKIEYER